LGYRNILFNPWTFPGDRHFTGADGDVANAAEAEGGFTVRLL